METSSRLTRLMASNGAVNHRVVITGESLVPTVTDQVLGKNHTAFTKDKSPELLISGVPASWRHGPR